MTDTPEALRQELALFRRKTGIPALGGALIDTTGRKLFEVVGVCTRGGQQPAALHHAWHIGSCAKAMTAALFATLVDEKLISWESRVKDVFSDLTNNLHEDWLECRFLDLFYCRAGMRANPPRRMMRPLWDDARELAAQRSDMAVYAMTEPPVKPGKFKYSNLGYGVIGAAIDRIAGDTYEHALHDRLLGPLGINSLGFGAPPDIQGHGGMVNLAPIVAFKGRPRDPSAKTSDNPPVFSAAGTLHMTLPDWSRFVRLLLNGGPPVLTPESVARLRTVPDGFYMGLGWGRANMHGVSLAAQGSNTMWSATVMLSDDFNTAALVTCNDGRTRVLAQQANLAVRLLAIARDKEIRS